MLLRVLTLIIYLCFLCLVTVTITLTSGETTRIIGLLDYLSGE